MKARSRMCRSSALLKQEFLKKWIKGYRKLYLNNDIKINILDRKNAIKLSSDVAIASTRKPATLWSRALISDVVSRDNGTNRIIVKQISGQKVEKRSVSTGLIACGNKILRKSRISRRKATRVVPQGTTSSSIAKRLVKNRTRVLKRLVPGGEEMDQVTLIREALDYIVSLRVQVDVMRRIASATERLETLQKNHLCN